MLSTTGIHHITAMVNDAQRTIDFYASVLGLRLVKKTINFDRPEVYHLYFGNETGDPGTVITFFPWPKQLKGRIGTGQVGVTSYAIPEDALAFWQNRLKTFQIEYQTATRFGEQYVQFEDPDGLLIELVERKNGKLSTWEFGGITKDVAIKGFAGAILYSAQPNETAYVLEDILGLQTVGQEDEFLRFATDESTNQMIDIKLTASVRGLMGAGTVHHIAWRAKDEQEHQRWRELLTDKGFHPTEFKDRNYFQAIYVQEKGGILFEIATDEPGFTVDEELEHLGEQLQLPEWLEAKREELEELVPTIEVRTLEEEEQS
ncbi:ring-cleaving dioxygenase [Gracilibacillus sp. S3-1-1]|uniref:Ring-cleaving dioxygenase n=1 Tax=Gracilibacillus pellucidus TaxID=3095368 RepID=A0ACC6M7I6_9BACI|nr:ring-cleaving dioxygenase [Gracilibacillus sp. S3-1-1]MDX8046853.1 ring-cleaving dioxygenase [Gracilibacillus sp. S3-1-1]